MTSDNWRTAIRSKWKGTWNLHEAIEGHDKGFDFILLTSSLSGSVGMVTESNHCSANSFLDALSRWLRSQGKPAISVGLGMISEVGYLHDNPDIEDLLLREGMRHRRRQNSSRSLTWLSLESERTCGIKRICLHRPTL